MKFRSTGKISAMLMALIFLCPGNRPVAALPLTETIYVITEENFEIIFREEIHRIDDFRRRERIGMGFGLLPRFSVWLTADYLHGSMVRSDDNVMGDMLLKCMYYAGDYAGNTLHLGFRVQVRIPSGPDAGAAEQWTGLSLGRNELLTGLSGKYDMLSWLFLHFNADYIFRQGSGESFYGGFHVNPASGDTYRTLLGLNPFADEAFLSASKLKNDYLHLSLALNTDGIYPFIPYAEASWTVRPWRGNVPEDSLPAEGGSLDPILISLGGRWFFTRAFYAGVFAVVNPLWNEDFTRFYFGIDLGVEF